MTKIMTIDFFRIKMPADSKTMVQDVIKKIADISDYEKRISLVDGWPIRLEEFNQHENYIEGDMTKIRMDNLPPKASIHFPVESLGLKDDEGLGEQNAFLYKPDLKILVYQSNGYGIGIKKLCRYLQAFVDFEGPINYEIVLEKEAYQRAESMRRMIKFDFKIANIERLKALETEDKGVINLLESGIYFDSPIFSGSLSYGKHTGNLMKSRVLETAKALLKIHADHPDTIDKIKLKGTNEADETTIIDLIIDKMRVEKTLEDVSGRWYPWKTRRELLKSALDEKISDLKLLFAKP